MGDRTLLRGGHVLTMDPTLGDLAGGDVLIDGDTIAQVGQHLEAPDAQVLDVTGDIVIPGFIDTHRHTWEAPIRTTAPDVILADYYSVILDAFAPNYRPEDVYAGNLWGSLECVDAGITTLVDWSHIANTPEHADAGIKGLQETGLRAVYAHGFPNTSVAEWWVNSSREHPEDARRIRKQYFSSDDGLITMAMSTRGPGFCTADVVRHDWELAKDLGINITVHVAMGPWAGTFEMVRQLSDLDLLYPNTTYIHSSHLTDQEWQMVVDSGGNVCLAPQVELQMGHGWAPAMKATKLGIPVGLSIDVVTSVPGDMFTQMHAIHSSERGRRHEIAWNDKVDVTDLLTTRQVLEFATIQGAQVAGIADRTGSLTPGKKADIVVIDGSAINMAPIIDPVAAVVTAAGVQNVETVIIDGRFHKRDGRLLADLTRPRQLVQASSDYLVGKVTAQPGWVVPAIR